MHLLSKLVPLLTRPLRAGRLPLLALLGVVGSAGLGACGGGAEERPPDVILIVVDTLRADMMSLHGYPRATTPRLDALAERGLVFDHALAGSSWTLPSMAMLMTGAYDGRNGGALDRDWATLAEGFAGEGYTTAAVVANPILGGDAGQGEFEAGFARGFDRFRAVHKRYGLAPGEVRQTNGWYADQVARFGVEELQAADGPTFLWLHLYDPHFPRTPRRGDVFTDEAPETTAAVRAWRAARLGDALTDEEAAYVHAELDAYDAEVWNADAAIGDLVDWLEREGRLEHTVIAITADHGEGLWMRHLPAGETPKVKNEVPRLYMDHGVTLHDEQVRVPLVLVGPGIEPGREARSVSLVDVAPTLRALAGGDWDGAPAGVGGRSLLDLRAGTQPAREVFTFCSRGSSVTLDGRWRLHWPSEGRVEKHGAVPELFDLAADPLERTALGPGAVGGGAAPEPLELGAYVERFREAVTPGDALSADDVARRRAFLDELGYVEQ